MAGRMRDLDFVKGVAILWIVAFHVYRDHPSLWVPSGFVEAGWKQVVLSGAVGVDLFVIVSGVLLAGAWGRAMRQEGSGWASFLRRRLFRLLPLYYAAVVLVIGMDFLVGRENFRVEPLSILTHLFAVHTFTPFIFTIEGAWWFVGLIVPLYVLYPILRLSSLRFGPALTYLGAVALSIVARHVHYANLDTNYSVFAFLPDFALGQWLSCEGEELRGAGLRKALPGIFVPLGAAVALWWALSGGDLWRVLHGVGRHFFAAAIFFIASAAAGTLEKRRLRAVLTVICAFGIYSYPIYLFHRPAIFKYFRLTGRYLPHTFALASFLLLLLAAGWALQTSETKLRTHLGVES